MKQLGELLEHVPNAAKEVLDLAAAFAMLATLVSALPKIAALFTIAWTSIRMWEWAKGRPTRD